MAISRIQKSKMYQSQIALLNWNANITYFDCAADCHV